MRDAVTASKLPGNFSRILVVSLFTAVLAACSEPAPQEDVEVIRPARLVEVTSTSDVREITLPAIIEASESVDLTFQLGGLLQELNVTEGDPISEGDVVGRLDQRELRTAVTTARAQFDGAEADFQRAVQLVERGTISRSAYDQRLTQRDVARAVLNDALRRLEDSTLLSPFTGAVATVHVSQFQSVSAQEPIITLQTTGTAEAVVQVPATLVTYSGYLEPLETVVVLDSASDVLIPAVLQSRATQADTATQTFEASFAFVPPENLNILPGMTGSLRATFRVSNEDGSSDQIMIPLTSILSDGTTQYVWLVNQETMTVTRRDISVGEGIGASLPVLEGLEAGDVIVGAGASYLHEGLQIRPYEN